MVRQRLPEEAEGKNLENRRWVEEMAREKQNQCPSSP